MDVKIVSVKLLGEPVGDESFQRQDLLDLVLQNSKRKFVIFSFELAFVLVIGPSFETAGIYRHKDLVEAVLNYGNTMKLSGGGQVHIDSYYRTIFFCGESNEYGGFDRRLIFENETEIEALLGGGLKVIISGFPKK